ncbi:MAG: large-conductance mechanosensitive channel protein MscL [Clostridia bacterium]|nr:large-conductance mechanosensitive channel protein MscL [Clostridia bacterium]
MKKFFSEFKEFAIKGNMLDLAVGVIIGGAFNTVVKSIVENIFMPIVGVLMGGYDFTELSITVGKASIQYGAFIQNIINFLITAFCLFLVVKSINSFKRKEEPVEEKPAEKPADILLLEEIRDSLNDIKSK